MLRPSQAVRATFRLTRFPPVARPMLPTSTRAQGEKDREIAELQQQVEELGHRHESTTEAAKQLFKAEVGWRARFGARRERG